MKNNKLLFWRKSSLKTFIKTKISKAKTHDFKKSENLIARPIIKMVEGFKIEYNCGEILKNNSSKTKMNIVE